MKRKERCTCTVVLNKMIRERFTKRLAKTDSKGKSACVSMAESGSWDMAINKL